jgi:hypothetical protein
MCLWSVWFMCGVCVRVCVCEPVCGVRACLLPYVCVRVSAVCVSVVCVECVCGV